MRFQWIKFKPWKGEGEFSGSVSTWTDNTFLAPNLSKVTRIGSPIYFSIEEVWSIQGLSYYVTYCKFGTRFKEFEFLRENGCGHQSLNVRTYDSYVTPTGERQRFQAWSNEKILIFYTNGTFLGYHSPWKTIFKNREYLG